MSVAEAPHIVNVSVSFPEHTASVMSRMSSCTSSQTGSDVWLSSAHAHQLHVNYQPTHE